VHALAMNVVEKTPTGEERVFHSSALLKTKVERASRRW